MNIADSIRLHAHQRPEKDALIFAGRVINYRQLWSGVSSLATALAAAGVSAGDRVGLCLKDHPSHLLMHYAIGSIGGVIVPIDHRWSATERDGVVDVFSPRLLVIDKGDAYTPSVTCITVGAWPDSAAALDVVTDSEHDELLISMSSGTTGRPKGALVSHRQLYERFVTQWVTLGFNTNDTFALVTPLYFGAGRSFGMAFLAAGATVLLAPPPHKGTALVDAIITKGVSATFLVPTAMRRLLAPDKAGLLFPNLRRLLISGEALYPAEVEDFQSRLSPNLIGYYASSEGGGVSVLQPQDFDDHGATVGQAAFGVEVQVVNDDDQRLGTGDVGRLRYRGPGVATTTLSEDGHAEPANPGGWFYPGDLASIDESGYVSLRGRTKNVIIRGGVNIYPAEIEQALIRHPQISEAAVLGASVADHGEEIVAFVAGAAVPAEADVNAWLAERLAPYKIPARYIALAELPRAASGKTNKKALRKDWLI